jgi:hypothetical protein
MEAKPRWNLVNDPLLRPIQAAHLLGINRHSLERMARGTGVSLRSRSESSGGFVGAILRLGSNQKCR